MVSRAHNTKPHAEGGSQGRSRRMGFLRGVPGFFRLVFRSLVDFVYPPQCCVCSALLDEVEATVCESCWRKIPLIGEGHCIRCGASWERVTDGCPNCLEGERRFQYVRILAPFDDTVRAVIHQLKYNRKRSLGLRLGAELGVALRGDRRFDQVAVVLPVPLHKARLKERGFNQSELLARGLGDALDKPVQTDVLVRTRYTGDQTKLSPRERRANVAGAFRVKVPARVAGKDVALVDDVVTTGATVDACSQALLASGARSVFVVAAARPFRDAGDEPQ